MLQRRVRLRGVKEGMEIHCERKLTGNDLADAYLRGEPGVRSLYDYDVQDPDFPANRARDLDDLYDESRRAELVSALATYARELGVEEQTEPLLAKLSMPGCLTVVTGQQAGLFVGPVYTLYKAVSAVALAKQYEAALGRPVVPVFWVASEDHDFEEVASASYVTRYGTVARASLRDRPLLRTPVGRHRLSGRDRERLLRELAAELPDGLYRDDVLTAVASAYQEGTDMATGFARLLSTWLKDLPILVVDPLRPELRALMRSAFEHVLAAPLAFHAAAVQGAQAVREAGFTPQVEIHDRHTLLYLLDQGLRHAIDLTDDADALALRDTLARMPIAGLRSRLAAHPEDFSAGVLYRPVTQDTLLPVLAYVGGAAEVAYHGMMRPVFAAAGRKVPPLIVRARALQIPQFVARSLESFGVSRDVALAPGWLPGYLAQDIAPSVSEVIAHLSDAAESLLASQRDYFLAIDPSMERSLRKTARSVEHSLSRLSAKTASALRRRRSEEVRAHELIMAWLMPDAHEQERILSPLSLITLYGTAWLQSLAACHPQMDQVAILNW